MVVRISDTRLKSHGLLSVFPQPAVPALEVQSLSAAYGDKPVLSEINFQIAAGATLALIGPNGAGKSSLIRAISGVLPLQSGQVETEWTDLVDMSSLERARLLAVVPQARNLPSGFYRLGDGQLGRTPHLNWLGQTSSQDDAVICQAMQRTQTLELASRRVGELSGGEQQRLLLARALAQAAPVMLLDEPTTHLDLKYQFALLDQVRSLARQDGLSVVLALHDLNLVMRYADQVALLVEGKLRAFGSPQEVLTPTLLSDAYGIDLQVVRLENDESSLIIPSDSRSYQTGLS